MLCFHGEPLPKHHAEAGKIGLYQDVSTFQIYPAPHRELRMAMSLRKKKPAVSADSRATTSGGGTRASQRPPNQLAGKRKASELASSGDTSEPCNRRPVPGAGSLALPANASAVTSEHAAFCSRELWSPEGVVSYAVALAGFIPPFQPSGLLEPTAMGE